MPYVVGMGIFVAVVFFPLKFHEQIPILRRGRKGRNENWFRDLATSKRRKKQSNSPQSKPQGGGKGKGFSVKPGGCEEKTSGQVCQTVACMFFFDGREFIWRIRRDDFGCWGLNLTMWRRNGWKCSSKKKDIKQKHHKFIVFSNPIRSMGPVYKKHKPYKSTDCS